MTEIKVVEAGPKDKDRWDEYVENHPDASPYHLFAWKEAVEKAYGHKGYYLIAETKNSVCGVLPAIHMSLPLMPSQLVALPFCDYGDLLVDNSAAQKQLIIEITSIAGKLKCGLVEIRSQEKQALAEQDIGTNTDAHKVRMLLDLADSSDLLLSGFKSKLRSQIRKAEKNGLSFRLGSKDDLEKFYYVFSKNMLSLGSPVHSIRWFEEVLKRYGSNCQMGLVEKDGNAVGVGIILTVANKVSIPWASTLSEFNRLSPNMLLYWNLLKFASDNGFTVFDFGRSSTDSGTFRFKAQWGAYPVKLDWYDIDMNGEKRKETSEDSSNRDLAASLWSRMPLSLANFLGPKIRKHISL